jgi:acyl carrier protein phosphodiesterase
MNYLAHLFLADDNAESLIGNLAGDFVKGALGDRFTPGIRKGIQHHRRVDAFTDSHPSVAAFRRVLIPDHGHYSRVIADMFFDHFLAVSWERYSPAESLDEFLGRVYRLIGQQVDQLPGRLQIVFPLMRDGRWLQSYAHVDGIDEALTNISKRLSRRPHLETATHHLIDSRAELERHFHDFFPDVVALSSGAR